MRYLAIVCMLVTVLSLEAQKTTEDVRVTNYLYGNVNKVDDAPGGLVIRFATPSDTRKVVAYGWSNRKLRKSRIGTTERQRENLKPRLAEMSEQGRVATFRKLAPDFYDVAVINYGNMTFLEGMTLHHLARKDNQPSENRRHAYDKEIRRTICGSREDGVAAWEGFFEEKQVDRIQYADDQAGVLVQQKRRGKAFAESGTALKGHIHSLDVVWLQKTQQAGHIWQVIQRQQLYRGELKNNQFFQQRYVPEFSGIRIGRRMKTLRKIFTDK